jgi:hypothetical protein
MYQSHSSEVPSAKEPAIHFTISVYFFFYDLSLNTFFLRARASECVCVCVCVYVGGGVVFSVVMRFVFFRDSDQILWSKEGRRNRLLRTVVRFSVTACTNPSATQDSH